MSEPLVLVFLLGTNADPTTEGMMAAARRALGPDAVVLADTSDSPTDTNALAIGERAHARAVARISWADSSRTVARLHVHVAPSTEWADDEISFLPQDEASEKGRTIGNAVASMVQRIERAHAEEAPKPPPVLPAVTVAPPDVTAEPPRPSPPRPTPAPGLDLFALGTGAVAGGATSIGGAGGLRWWPLSRLGLRAAFGARAGMIGEADASTTTLFAAAGPGYRIPLGSAVELGARADFVLLQHAVTRGRAMQTTRTRWLGAVDLVLEASWSLSPRAGLIAGAGAELAFGTTPVSVGGVPLADIPPVRGIGELGVRFRF